MSKIKTPADSLMPVIASAMHKWLKENDEISVEQKVFQMLDDSRQTVMLQLLGLKKDWHGKYEVDHCNGRNGNSIIGEHIKKAQEGAIKLWMDKVKLPTLTAAMIKSIETDMKQTYESEFRRQLREQVSLRAFKDVDQLLKELIEPVEVENYFKAIALLENNSE